MVVEALYFQREQIGFALFEVGTPDERTYEALRRYLSSALQGTLLVQRVQERSAEIARQKYILDTFMDDVPDSIYFKDRTGAFTKINTALATLFDLDHPADAIGKTDFDFMPAEFAQAKYDQEQTIIQTDSRCYRSKNQAPADNGRLPPRCPFATNMEPLSARSLSRAILRP